MLDFVAELVSKKAIEIADQEISKCRMEHLDIDFDAELTEVTRERAISQLTFNLT